MTSRIIAVYDTAGHTDQAIAALLTAGVPHTSIHRHIREGDDLTGERPAIIERDGHGIWSTLFGTDHPVDHVIHDGEPEAGGTVVRVTMIPDAHYEAVLDILGRYHPADVQGREVSGSSR
jgi:hypothetical protein